MNGVSLYAGLTEQQRAFVRGVTVYGRSPVDSVVAAGFAESHAAETVARFLQVPAVRRAIHVGVQQALLKEAPVSLRVLTKIRDDETAPPKVRADIAIKLLSFAGLGNTSDSETAPDKPLSEMSAAELRAHIDRTRLEIAQLEGQLADRAKDVSAPLDAPKGPVIDAKPLDFLD